MTTAKVSRLLGRTGKHGRVAMNTIGDDATTLNRLLDVEDTGMQRAMARMAARSDVSKPDVDAVMARYSDLTASQQRTFAGLIDEGGEEALLGSKGLTTTRLQRVLDADVTANGKAAALRNVHKAGSATLGDTDRVRDLALRWVTRRGVDSDDALRAGRGCNSPCLEWAAEFADRKIADLSDSVDYGLTKKQFRKYHYRVMQTFQATGSDAIDFYKGLDHKSFNNILGIDVDVEDDWFGGFDDWRSWRANLIRAERTTDVDTPEVEEYINNVAKAGRSNKIDNPAGLVDELSGSSRSYLGQYGETRSAIRYLNKKADIDVEPGNGDYDLRVIRDSNTEYVEVKSRRSIPDSQYIDGKISDMNRKFDNAANDPDVDVTNDRPILEIQSRAPASKLDEAVSEAETAIETRKIAGSDIHIEEIRIVMRDGTSEAVQV